MRLRPWIALAMIVPCLLIGCASSPEEPEQTITTAAAATTEEPETVATIATEPTTLPPATPPEEVLPEIESQLSDVNNARFYIDGSTLCLDTYDEDVTQTGAVAYDGFEGSDKAWELVVGINISRCTIMRHILDNQGAYDTTARVNVLDHRFTGREILTIVDGEVVEDTVAAERAVARTTLPNVSGRTSDIVRTSGGQMVWIPTNGGDKYHTSASAHNMKNPEKVIESEAIRRGFGRCKICFG